jgi:hypothetical protein
MTTYNRLVNAQLPKPSADVVYRELADEAVLVHLATSRIYSLNPTGARFWALLASGWDRDRIEQQLLTEFEVTPAELRHETDALLTSLEKEGLIT